MNRPVRLTCGLLFISLLCMIVLSASASMSVAPLSLRLDISPGEDGAGAFLVRNTGPEPITVNLSLHDWWRTPEGDFQILAPETLDRSCAGWMVYSATTLDLAPNEESQVSVQLAVPDDVSGDHWALLLVEEQPQPAEQEQADEGLTNTTRVVVTYAVKILQDDPVNDAPDATIQGIEILDQDPLQIRVRFANTGNTHVTTEGTIEVRDIFGDTVRSLKVDPFPALPGEERLLLVEDPSTEPLAEGPYFLIALFDFGGDHLIQGGLPFQVAAPEPSEET